VPSDLAYDAYDLCLSAITPRSVLRSKVRTAEENSRDLLRPRTCFMEAGHDHKDRFGPILHPHAIIADERPDSQGKAPLKAQRDLPRLNWQ